MRIDLVPDRDQPPAEGTPPSQVLARIADAAPSRRTILRGLAIAAATATLVPFQWAFSRTRALAAGPTTEHINCQYYGLNYTPQANNWWAGLTAACHGGARRGSYPCNENERHFEGWRTHHDERYNAMRTDNACNGKNAWRWAASGNVFRCSDAYTEIYWNDGSNVRHLTVARCFLNVQG